MSTTTRARLQELGLDALRDMASKVDVEHKGLQKTKLITAILDSEKFDVGMLPEPKDGEADPAVAEPKPSSRNGERAEGGDDAEASAGDDTAKDDGDREQRFGHAQDALRHL